jgi:gluconolactonase
MSIAPDTSLDELIAPDATLERLGDGYEFTEGPVWDPRENCLYFSDIPGDTRWRWDAENGMQVSLRPTFKANGMALDVDGSLLVCEQVTSCLVRYRRPDFALHTRELVAFHYGGRYLNSPNDVVARGADGAVYFTDPDYGRWNDWIGQQRSRDGVGFRGLYRVPRAGGPPQLLVAEDEFDQPNGLCFSPDEKILYVNDSASRNVKAFEVAPDGSLSSGEVLVEGVGTGEPRSGNVDGMECDERGNVWVTGPGGVWVLAPDGRRLGVVAAPEVVGSLCWGGEDMRHLFLMTSTSAHVVRTLVGPAPLPPFD